MAAAKHTLPTILLQGAPLTLPHITTVLPVGRTRSLHALTGGQNSLLFTTLKGPDGAHTIGTVGRILQLSANKQSPVRNVCFEGLYRARIDSLGDTEHALQATVSQLDYTPEDRTAILGHRSAFLNALEQLSGLSGDKFTPVLVTLHRICDHEQLVYTALHYLDIIPLSTQYEILASPTLSDQLILLTEEITKQTAITSAEHTINNQIHRNTAAKQRKRHLESKLEEIQKMLGGNEQDWDNQINNASMPDHVKQRAREEVKKLAQFGNPAEANISRNYLEHLLAIPWATYSPNTINLREAEKILETEHYGLSKVKNFILDYIAVSDRKRGQVMCLFGPPGVGKTSLAQSIAKALGKEFASIPLGGVHDESEIRGHRRTYLGAMPGKIVAALSKCKTMNPLILLDEIDKLGTKGLNGDPSAALLEVLDSNQNKLFQDHYIDLGINLADVTFIATANSLDTIQPALLDRMETLTLSSYSVDQKITIAKRHLIPKIQHELCPSAEIVLTPRALRYVIDNTAEAGVRKLDQTLGQLVRRAIRYALTSSQDSNSRASTLTTKLQIQLADVRKHLGALAEERRPTSPQIGAVNGLAWSPYGGVLLPMQVTALPGTGQNTMTGMMGDVMKESVMIARTLVTQYLKKCPAGEIDTTDKCNIHLHAPDGAVNKNGPSAGLAILIALLSELFQVPVSHTLAMTGEIDLKGRVLPVGGVKEKLLAAHRAGIKTILLPTESKNQLDDIPSEILAGLDKRYVSGIESAISVALPTLLSKLQLKPDLEDNKFSTDAQDEPSDTEDEEGSRA